LYQFSYDYIGKHEIRLASVHQLADGIGVGRVSADEPMPTESPDVAGQNKSRLFKGGCQVEVVVGYVAAGIGEERSCSICSLL
jgi:hypothetical protein